MEVDHDRQVVHTETLGLALHEPEALLLEVFVGGRRETLVSLAFCRGP